MYEWLSELVQPIAWKDSLTHSLTVVYPTASSGELTACRTSLLGYPWRHDDSITSRPCYASVLASHQSTGCIQDRIAGASVVVRDTRMLTFNSYPVDRHTFGCWSSCHGTICYQMAKLRTFLFSVSLNEIAALCDHPFVFSAP